MNQYISSMLIATIEIIGLAANITHDISAMGSGANPQIQKISEARESTRCDGQQSHAQRHDAWEVIRHLTNTGDGGHRQLTSPIAS